MKCESTINQPHCPNLAVYSISTRYTNANMHRTSVRACVECTVAMATDDIEDRLTGRIEIQVL